MTQSDLDPRGPRFGAALTVVVLGVVLATAPGVLATVLLAVQALSFAAGAALGLHRSPQAWLYRRLVRPALGPPSHWEAANPPRFAQAVGLAFALAGLAGFVSGATAFGLVATVAAFVAALLNAAFGICLGCDLYLLSVRWSRRSQAGATVTTHS